LQDGSINYKVPFPCKGNVLRTICNLRTSVHFLFYRQVVISLHESIILSLVLVILRSILWKWNKALLVIINLEVVRALVISRLFLRGRVLSRILMLVLVFFVREALVMLRSLYSRIRFLGVAYGGLLLW